MKSMKIYENDTKSGTNPLIFDLKTMESSDFPHVYASFGERYLGDHWELRDNRGIWVYLLLELRPLALSRSSVRSTKPLKNDLNGGGYSRKSSSAM